MFWAIGIAHLYAKHPHEDAFILFRYAEHTAHGLGITWNAGGPPTEGATDFLWMIGLSGLVRLGLDVAVAAVLLNALASASISLLLYRALLGSPGAGNWFEHVLCWLLALCVPFIGGALASYEGFSSQLYCALSLLTYGVYLGALPRTTRLLPYLALCLGLFRPDGVILGLVFYALCMLRCFAERACLRRLLVHGLCAAVLGSSYFVFRYAYFGELLPLPLYVKSRGTDRLLGLSANRDWLISPAGAWPVVLVMAVLGATLWFSQRRPQRVGWVLSGTLPGVALLLALTFAHQSQNVDFRFQAPVYLLFLAATVTLAADIRARHPPSWIRTAALAGAVAAALPALLAGKTSLWTVDYLDSLAVRMARPVDASTSLVLTEAGRLAYWTPATVHDMVGLNDARTAKRPATADYVRSLKPDIVMFHHAGALALRRARPLTGSFARDGVVQIDPTSLRKAVKPNFRRYLKQDVEPEQHRVTPTKAAALALTRFLTETPGFDVFAVRYYGEFWHVFAIKAERPNASLLKRLLLGAHQDPYLSYAAAKAFAAHGLSCRIVARLSDWLGSQALGLPNAPDCDYARASQSQLGAREERLR